MAYATTTQFLLYYDVRRVSQLLSDSGTPVSLSDVSDNAILIELLNAASEMVAAAALVGQRYSDSQLSTLASSGSAGYLLRKLTIDLAFSLLVTRRGQGAADVERLCPSHAESIRLLDQLRLGYTLFPGIDDTSYGDAGLPKTAKLDSTLNIFKFNKFTAYANRLFPWSCERQVTTTTDGCS